MAVNIFTTMNVFTAGGHINSVSDVSYVLDVCVFQVYLTFTAEYNVCIVGISLLLLLLILTVFCILIVFDHWFVHFCGTYNWYQSHAGVKTYSSCVFG